MPLELLTYDVAVARDGLDLDKAIETGEGDGYDVHRVTVLHADQLVAEQVAPRFGIGGIDTDNAPKMTWATLWTWCALRRMGVGVGEFPPFKGRVLDLTPVKKSDLVGADDLGPTEQQPDTGLP